MPRLAAPLFLCTLAAACGEDADAPVEPTFASLQEQVFERSCNFEACHSDRARNGGLTLQGPDAYDNLLGVTPVVGAAASDGLKRVIAGDPDGSFLRLKLDPRLETRYGARMPLNGDPLPEDEREAIRQWIADGAPP